MKPKEFAEMRASKHAPCGCRIHVDGPQHSCHHNKNCALLQPEPTTAVKPKKEGA